ncbi:MAG: cytochrome d ubiquinol oxidase subunit II [Methylococcales bacterium]|nr:cytochrome d ubiquinol oxidase subunit II [Methylococcales bacterium]
MNVDYEILRCLSWGILWLIVIIFSLSGGYNLGVSILFPFLAKTDEERQTLLKSLGVTWNGHQLWFITIGLVLFTAWPMVYMVLFSGMYAILSLACLALFIRPFIVYYRNKLLSEKKRFYCDKALFLTGFIPIFALGIAIGNLLKGVPFHLDSDMRIIYYGDFWSLLNPFTFLTMITTLGIFMLYGAVYIQLKTDGEMAGRAKEKVQLGAIITVIGFVLTGLWVMRLEGYHIESETLFNGVSNPLAKFVKRGEGLWMDNYEHIPALAVIPIMALISCGLTVGLSIQNKLKLAFISSGVTLVFMIVTMALSMFPFMLPSNMSLNSSLSLWDASSSYKTLSITFWVTLLFLPVAVIYTRWVSKLLRLNLKQDLSKVSSQPLL